MPSKYFVCPRCDYKSLHKVDMKRHFGRKNPCVNDNDVDLTEEVKELVLTDRIYHPPKKSLNASITINTLNKFVANMSFNEKMTHVLDYKQKRLVCFEDRLETRFENRSNRLLQNKYPDGFFLDENGFYKLIDTVTKVDKDHIEDLNVFYKKTVKRFELYSGTSWESFIEEEGANELIRLMKSYFLDTYEQYLIRHLHCDKYQSLNRYKLLEHLKIYYKFIAIFELRPSIADIDDDEILGHSLVEDNNRHLAETYMNLYGEEKNKLKKSDINTTKRKVINIIKENTIHNISELNEIIIEILKTDDTFRQQLLTLNEPKLSLTGATVPV